MANRPDDEAMTLYFWGEHPAPEEFERALAADPELQRRYDALARDLRALRALEAPEPRPGLETRMWARVEPELRRAKRSPWEFLFNLRIVATAAVALVLIVAGFLTGRLTSEKAAPIATTAAAQARALPATARARVLDAALASHFDATERLLVEVANDTGAATASEEEQRAAAALLEANRLYRRAAEKAHDRRVLAVLGELEPLLAELAHAPAGRGGAALDAARERLETQDLLFKVRITRSNI